MDVLLESLDKDYPDPLPCNIRGRVPAWLSGSLLRNGPGKFRVGADNMRHLFDGMAVLHRYNFKDGAVTYQNRLLDSETFKRNTAANRIVCTEFGTAAFPDPCKCIFTRYFSHYFGRADITDNTLVNFLETGDRVFAMTETNRLNVVDVETLTKADSVDLDKLVSVHGATAHPQTDPADGAIYNLGTHYGSNCQYKVIRIPPPPKDGASPASPLSGASVLASVPARWRHSPCYSHSFCLTEHHLVLVEQPMALNSLKMLASNLLHASPLDALTFYPQEETRFHVIKKATGEVLNITYSADAMFMFHTINAYEENGCLVCDMCCYDNGDIMKRDLLLANLRSERPQYSTVSMRRFVIPVEGVQAAAVGDNLSTVADSSATAVKRQDGSVFLTPQIYNCEVELPRVNEKYNARKYQFFYGINFIKWKEYQKSPNFQIIKFDLDTESQSIWSPDDPDLIPGEPVFIASPSGREEDDGVVLSPVSSVHPSKPPFLLVLDAATFTEIGRAELPAGTRVPMTFHGIFSKEGQK